MVNLRFVIFSAALARPLAAAACCNAGCAICSPTGVFATCLERLRHEADPNGGSATTWRHRCGARWCGEFGLTGVLAAGAIPPGWSLEFMANIALLVLLVPMARVRPMLVAMLTGGALSVLLRDLPLRLGVMAAIVARHRRRLRHRTPAKRPEAR